ncbi:MAG: hypothetical protein HQL36_01005 [Alphaproteobacteria bacterium]|nr:hypothetical protein [Alphaproteobacteria bacterium]MBF0249717.1 hypothetical protein [Alphaproteobacteria bacterium]
MAERGPFTVWVLGGEVEDVLSLKKMLPDNGALGVLGARFNEIADRYADDLVNLDRQIVVEDADALAWNASLIADRSPFAGDLQLNATRFLAVWDILADGGAHIFFVEGREAAYFLLQTAHANGLGLKGRFSSSVLGYYWKAVKVRLGVMSRHLKHQGVLKKLRGQKPIPWDALRSCDVLLFDWTDGETFNMEKQTARINHLSLLPDILRRSGLNVGFIANPLGWVHHFPDIARNVCFAHDPVVMTCEMYSFSTVLRGAWESWRMNRRLKGKIVLGGIDITPLFDWERLKDLSKPQPTQAYAYGDIAKFLKEHGLTPKSIVYPYENQGLERALVAGIHAQLPDVRAVACQSAPFATRYLGFIPSRTLVGSAFFPDHVIVMGKWYFSVLSSYGVPEDGMTMGGSLRFHAVPSAGAVKSSPGPASERRILVGTSVDFHESADLVGKASEALKNIPGARMVVNFHPHLDKAFKSRLDRYVREILGENADRYEASFESIRTLMANAHVLLYNNSGVAFDALVGGIPAINVAIDCQVSYDKVPDSVSNSVATADELTALLKNLFENGMGNAGHPDPTVGGSVGALDECAIVNAVIGPGVEKVHRLVG